MTGPKSHVCKFLVDFTGNLQIPKCECIAIPKFKWNLQISCWKSTDFCEIHGFPADSGINPLKSHKTASSLTLHWIMILFYTTVEVNSRKRRWIQGKGGEIRKKEVNWEKGGEFRKREVNSGKRRWAQAKAHLPFNQWESDFSAKYRINCSTYRSWTYSSICFKYWQQGFLPVVEKSPKSQAHII